ncbi:MAG: anaerobic ribonucleoside-triphosphate reductase activating protein [Clostridia bacterium]|jgi:anaerobic ribonucleoside-triphosphate reductase activating protein|nr:anaerobic ribonucleoside-triphosphate reductase activating protein [Clostridia bacterium]
MNYAKIKECDVANGPGVRVSLFVSGCNHRCKGCFNQVAWDFNYGKEFTQETIDTIIKDLDKDYIEGLTLLGGEPLEKANQKGLVDLVKQVREKLPNKSIWCYTGFDFEKDVMGKMYQTWEETKELISDIDVIVDGKFELEKKNPSLKFRGSENQRLIDVKKSIANNKIIWADIEDVEMQKAN